MSITSKVAFVPLEMEEDEDVEELSLSTNRNQDRNSVFAFVWNKRSAALMLFLLVGIILGIASMPGKFWEGKGRENVDDVEKQGEITTATGRPIGDDASQDGGFSEKKNYEDFGASHYPKPSQVVKPDPPLTSEKTEELSKEWGKWEFIDKKKDQRPTEDYCAKFPNRDIPRDNFPANAWQTDNEYLTKFLDQGLKLVERAMEAILSEYGSGKRDKPDLSFEERCDSMFKFLMYDLQTEDGPGGKYLIQEAGWTSEKSFQGLVRRVLHAIMTNDSFTIIMDGDSPAAGHGNLFKQSYTMQTHKVMEPVFSLLGVNLVTRNIAHGGLGTLQTALGFADINGDEIDYLIWDSGMTEGRDTKAVDLFYRQAFVSGNRIPFIMSAGTARKLVYYTRQVGADVGNVGEGLAGVPECTDAVQCEKLPWATRYLKCSQEARQICSDHKFRANCWVDRDDVTPLETQNKKPGAQVKWHPGFRSHQLTGRVHSFFILKAINAALSQWKNSDNLILPDEDWHVSDYYSTIRQKVMQNNETECFEYGDMLPIRMCTMPIRARTEFTPRANPEKTSLTSIIKPNEKGIVPHIGIPLLYTGPDVYNPFTAIPDGEIDVLSIVSLGRTYTDDEQGRRQMQKKADDQQSRRRTQDIVPGLGWELYDEPPGYCDGSYNSECSRNGNCLLSGHNDARGGIRFDGYSGWLVMTLPSVKDGLIVTKLETWHEAHSNELTKGWTSIDNKGRRLRGMHVINATDTPTVSYSWTRHEYEQDSRRLKLPPPEFCDEFTFEFAIDGKITVWGKDRFLQHDKSAQRVVELQTLLDDPNFTSQPKDVELAIRMTGCADTTGKTMSLTHVYFA